MALDPNTVNLDPQAKALLTFLAQDGRIPYSQITPPLARAQYVELCRRTRKPDEWAVDADDVTLPGPTGTLHARVYRPRGAGDAALPALLYFHGGGWCIGDIDTHDAACRQLTQEAGCAVLSLDYRLAPEHRFPAAVEDCFAALKFAIGEGRRLGLDPTRLAVGGDSAGGNLAAVAALRARDAGITLKGQVLIYPATDFAGDTASHEDYAEGFLLTRESVAWFGGNYIDASGHGDWRASPLRAVDLSGVAPALVLTCSCDPLCDEGMAYAQRLEREGVRVMHLHFSDEPHAFVGQGKVIRAGNTALDMMAAALKKVLWPPPPIEMPKGK